MIDSARTEFTISLKDSRSDYRIPGTCSKFNVDVCAGVADVRVLGQERRSSSAEPGTLTLYTAFTDGSRRSCAHSGGTLFLVVFAVSGDILDGRNIADDFYLACYSIIGVHSDLSLRCRSMNQSRPVLTKNTGLEC